MDSISHLALGVIIAKAVTGNKYGKKVLIYGAIAASFPDFDVLLSPFFNAFNNLLIHRGLSHSIAFMLVIAPLLTYLSRFIDRDINLKFITRLTIVMLAWISHIVIDIFNTYGTTILAPFSSYRFTIDSLPIFPITLFILLTAIALLIVFNKRLEKYNQRFAFIGIAITILYISTSTVLKYSIERNVKESTNTTRIYTSPLPLTICKWKYVAEYANCFQVGLIGVTAMERVETSDYILKNHNLLSKFENYTEVEKIKLFTKGFYSVAPSATGLNVYDLRFSSMAKEFPDAHVLTFTVEQINNGDIRIKPSHLKRHIIK